MTFNVISDLHCDYDNKSNTVVWNINPFYDSDSNRYIFEDENYSTLVLKCIDHIYKIEAEITDKKDNIEKIDFKNIHLDPWLKIKNRIYTVETCLSKLKKLRLFLQKDKTCYSDHKKYLNYVCEISEFISHCDLFQLFDSYHIKLCLNRKYCMFKPENLEPADYLLVCGDLAHEQTYRIVYNELKERTRHLFKDVFFVKGNHDYWWFPNPGQTYTKDFPKSPVLNDRYVEKDLGDNVILLGCTLNSPVSEENKFHVLRMNDYRYSPGWTVDKVNEMYQQDSNWLREKVKQYSGKKIVIMTHHLPRKELIEGRYSKSGGLNAAYAVLDGSCDDIKPTVWCCGHSHAYVEMNIDGVRYIRNPIGYREFYGYENSEVSTLHWYNTIIEV